MTATRTPIAFGPLVATLVLLLAVLVPPSSAEARGGGGVIVRPSVITGGSLLQTADSVPVAFAIGGRGVLYPKRFVRFGGEALYDPRTGLLQGGGLLEGVIPLPGPGEVQLGASAGACRMGWYLEPGVGIQIAARHVALEARLSYLFYPQLEKHTGQTNLTLGLLFGGF